MSGSLTAYSVFCTGMCLFSRRVTVREFNSSYCTDHT